MYHTYKETEYLLVYWCMTWWKLMQFCLHSIAMRNHIHWTRHDFHRSLAVSTGSCFCKRAIIRETIFPRTEKFHGRFVTDINMCMYNRRLLEYLDSCLCCIVHRPWGLHVDHYEYGEPSSALTDHVFIRQGHKHNRKIMLLHASCVISLFSSNSICLPVNVRMVIWAVLSVVTTLCSPTA